MILAYLEYKDEEGTYFFARKFIIVTGGIYNGRIITAITKR